MKDLTISLIQANLHWEEVDANLAMFEEMIWTVNQTDIIILPEMFTTGFSTNAQKLAEPIGGKTFKWMKQLANQRDVAITGSYMIKEKQKYYNRLFFVYPNGSVVHYDKKHLFGLAAEQATYTSGKERLILEFRGWKIHPLICYDLRFPLWARSQHKVEDIYEYDLLLYVANWPDIRIDAWDALLKSRAIENMAYCAGVNRVGLDASSKNYNGHSAIYSFNGEEQAFAKGEEKILTTILSAKNLTTYRKKFPFQKDADHFKFI